MEICLVYLFGAVSGAVVNCCVDRLLWGKSSLYCLRCGKALRWQDIWPIVSWFSLGRCCCACQYKIAGRHVYLECLLAAIAVLFYVQSGLSVEFAAGMVYSAFLLGIAFIDYERGVILNKVLWGLAGTGLLANIFLRHVSLADIFVGSLIGGGVLLFLLVLTQGGMGGGDVKFGAALGIWLGWQNSLLVLFLAFVLGGIVGFLLLCCGRKRYGDSLPFGPFLAIGGWVSYVYGWDILRLYGELF